MTQFIFHGKTRDLPDGLSIPRIAAILGVTYPTAKVACEQNHYLYRCNRKNHATKLDVILARMGDIRPGMAYTELAEHLKISVPSARIAAARCGYVARCQSMRAKWQNVNWEKPNSVIARELNMSREMVRLQRKRLKKPRSQFERMSLPESFVKWKWQEQND